MNKAIPFIPTATLCLVLAGIVCLLFVSRLHHSQRQTQGIMFALSNPNHFEDWELLHTELIHRGLSGPGVEFDLGCAKMGVSDVDFERAHAAAVSTIRKQHLTVRIAAHPTQGDYEVWNSGNLVSIDNYTVK